MARRTIVIDEEQIKRCVGVVVQAVERNGFSYLTLAAALHVLLKLLREDGINVFESEGGPH